MPLDARSPALYAPCRPTGYCRERVLENVYAARIYMFADCGCVALHLIECDCVWMFGSVCIELKCVVVRVCVYACLFVCRESFCSSTGFNFSFTLMSNRYPKMCGCDHGPRPASQYESIREQIKAAMNDDLELIGPAFIRLAWHSSATYDSENLPHGGPSGATMRFAPESDYEDNRGLDVSSTRCE